MWFWISISLRNCIWEFNPRDLLPSFRKAYQRFFAFIIFVRVCQNFCLNSSISNGIRPYTLTSWSKVLAMGLMSSIVSIGSVILQSSVNTFGAVIISAQTAARRIMAFALLPMTAISASMTTFASQNLGAKRPDRIVQGLRIGSRLSISWAVFVCIFLFFASPALVSFLASSTDSYLVENGSLYLQISSAFYPILSLLLIYRNCLQGLGQKVLPLVSSFIELIGKIAFVVLIIPWAGYKGVILCEPLIWVAMTIQLYFSLFRHPLIKEGKEILATKVLS